MGPVQLFSTMGVSDYPLGHTLVSCVCGKWYGIGFKLWAGGVAPSEGGASWEGRFRHTSLLLPFADKLGCQVATIPTLLWWIELA